MDDHITTYICYYPYRRVHYRDLSAHVGMHDRLETSHSVLRLSNGVKHPKFTSNAVRDINDIAVLTLEKKLKFSDKVRSICLPDEGNSIQQYLKLSFKDIPENIFLFKINCCEIILFPFMCNFRVFIIRNYNIFCRYGFSKHTPNSSWLGEN